MRVVSLLLISIMVFLSLSPYVLATTTNTANTTQPIHQTKLQAMCTIPAKNKNPAKTCYYNCDNCKDKTTANTILQQMNVINPNQHLPVNVTNALATIRSTMQYVQNTPYTTTSKYCYISGDSCYVSCNQCMDKTMCLQVDQPTKTILASPNMPYDVTTVTNNLRTACNFISCGQFISPHYMWTIFTIAITVLVS